MSNNSDIKKSAIILLNLGGPDNSQGIKKFLFNLFYDPAIMRLPNPIRWIVAKLISILRYKKAKNTYGQIGGKSPIYAETIQQANKLKEFLADHAMLAKNFEVFISMRHFYPTMQDIMDQLINYDPGEVILLPLYPQFSTTTTNSSIEECKKFLRQYLPNALVKAICCYPTNQDFINAHSKLINDSIARMNDIGEVNYRILFSAHSLPTKIIKNGDPYQWQITKTVDDIIIKLAIDNLDYVLSYQSKVGPIEWLQPATENEIKKAGRERKSLIIVPIAFTSEHVETLVELDIEYKAIADYYKINYLRVPTISINDFFIKSLAEMAIKISDYTFEVTANDSMARICPENFTSCPCNIIN